MTPAPSPMSSFAGWMPATVAAALLVAAVFAFEGHVGFNPADEGFLWYGVREALLGAVPIRDFMAYDIGRYGWSAAFAALSGDDGLVALRVSVALFQWLGLAVALAWLARAVPSRGAWLLGALALLAWMFPSHKVYDIVVCLLLIAATAAVVDAPSIRRYLAAGVVLGLAAVMGRNHGVYGAVAMLGAVAWNRAAGAGPGPWAALGAGSAGVVAGYAPMLLLLAFDGGFRVAFVDDLRMMFEAGSTNLPLPVPWPHLAFSGAATGFALLREVLVGLMFVALPAFVVAGAALASRSGAARLRAAPLFVACLLLAAPYAHFAFSRADVPHLAQGVFPVLLGLLAWPGPGGTAAPRAAAIRAVLLLAIGLVVVGPVRPGTASRVGTPWPETRIGRDTLRIAPSTAADLAMVRHHVGPHAPGTRDVLVAPNWIGMYPALDLRAPVWEIYMLFPANERRQRAEIRRMEDAGVRLAIVRDGAFDGREARRFRNTHPLLQAWLDDGFRVVARERSAVVYVRDDEALPGPAK